MRKKQQSLFSSGPPENKIEKEKIIYEVGIDVAPKPLSVSEFIALINGALRELEVQITGEITKASFPPSGHVYFSLKDEKDESVIDCVIWRSQYEVASVKLEAGMRIVALGHADVYPPTGRLAFKARAIELTGEGVLKKRYEELKRKLAAEGVFDEARKRRIPDYPQRVGVITSRNGAVIHDILNNLGQFGYKVILADARVEGPEAVASLRMAMKQLSAMKLDVLIIARGGGSMEALQAFDNELLIHDLLDFPVPVIAGIGHHQDVPLAALAADAHASTPTAVANLLNRSWQEASFRLAHESEKIFSVYRNIVAGAESAFDLAPYLQSLERMSKGMRLAMSDWATAIPKFFNQIAFNAKAKIDIAERVITANDPARNLRLGYSIARRNGKILKSVKGVAVGDDFDLQLKDGIIQGRVNKKQ
jgi:exodeoxyribonuclease VII large subunit